MNKMILPKKVLVASDSFKGTISSSRVALLIKETLLEIDPSIDVDCLPIADGGEGSVEALYVSLGGEIVEIPAKGPNFQPIQANYLRKGDIAVIEAASACGLTLAKEGSSPISTTTFGVGELILDAIKGGAKQILLCIGGVATNDVGVGMAAALGVRFFNHEGEEFLPVGGTLGQITHMDLRGLEHNIKGVDFEVLVDVKNPLYGENGATRIYGPQKGATKEEIEQIEAGVIRFAGLLESEISMHVSAIPGSGAAGGLGAGALAFLGAKLVPGISKIMELINFRECVKAADLIITGEGRLDAQSKQGKVISGVIELAKHYKKEVVAVVGSSSLSEEETKCFGLSLVIETSPNKNMDEIKKTCESDLKRAVSQAFGKS